MKKKPEVPILKVRKGATLAEIYARAREELTLEDLQKFAEVEDGIPGEQVFAEMQAIHRQVLKEKRKNKKKAI